jgi:hypothetical protein
VVLLWWHVPGDGQIEVQTVLPLFGSGTRWK